MSGGSGLARAGRCLAGAVALTAPLAVVPTSGAAAAERDPWWCAPDAVLRADALPDVLPAAACAVEGRAVVGASGYGVVVPPAGHAVAGTTRSLDGVEVVSVWADEYGVHVRGGELAAAAAYLGAMRAHAATGAGDRSDLGRMALSVRRIVYGATGRVRPQPVPLSELLDAADTLVAAFGGAGASAEAVTRATATLAPYLALVAERDDAPAAGELSALAEHVRAVVRSGAFDAVAAERALTETVILHNAVAWRQGDEEAAALGAAGDVLGQLVTALRAALVAMRPLPSSDTQRYEAALADVSEFYGQYVPDGSPSVPQVSEPGIGSPVGDTTSQAAPHPCADGARRAKYADRAHWERDEPIPWYYNHSYRYPAYYAEHYAAALQRAFDNMTDLNDDCGYTWRPKISHWYRGYATQTSTQPLDSEGHCQQLTDFKNIVAWRTLPSRMLARVCTYREGGVGPINGFDIAINRTARWDIPVANYAMGDSCYPYAPDEEYDFEAALTHEFGHALGLAHVSEAAHGNLTMSEMLNGPCNRAERSPGYGDAIGLAVLYTRDY